MIHLLFALVLGSAHAADTASDVRIESVEDGVVQSRFVVNATPEEVRALMADPVQAGRLVPDVVRVQVLSTKGACDDIVTTTRVPGTTMDYHSMRCRTASGIRDTLVDSTVMQDFYANWDYRAVEGGTEVTVKIKSVVDIPVPSYFVRVGLQTSLKATITNLISALANK